MRPELQGLPEPQWFHHGEQLLALLDEHRPSVCVELGTHRGGSAIATARLIQGWGGQLFCVDTWTNGVPMQECEANIAAAGLNSVVRLLQSDTARLGDLWSGSIDYLYVDAGHTYQECLRDLESWWGHLRVGGIIAGDDYDDPHGMPSEGVTAAWDEFERTHGQAFTRAVSPALIGCQCERCRAGRLIWGIKQ